MKFFLSVIWKRFLFLEWFCVFQHFDRRTSNWCRKHAIAYEGSNGWHWSTDSRIYHFHLENEKTKTKTKKTWRNKMIRSYHTVFPSRNVWTIYLHSKNVWTIYCSIFLSIGSVLSFSVLILFFCHSNEDKVGSHHFSLHFLVDEWRWASFSVFLGLTSLWFVHFSCLGIFFFLLQFFVFFIRDL